MKLSGSVAAVSEVTDLMAGLTVGKSDDTESISDSAISTASIFSEATSTRVQKSSHVSTQDAHKILSIYIKIASIHWCVLKN